jgi:hypothetical protein
MREAVRLRNVTGGGIVWDQHHNSLDTWQSLLAVAGGDPVVVLEDDVRLTDGWASKVEAVIAEHPDDVIQFFSNRKADVTRGSRWEPGRSFLMNQCHYLPAGVAAELLEFSHGWRANNPQHPSGQDVATAAWMRRTGRQYWLHVPSLVQHMPWRSVLGTRSKGRQSRTFQ